MKKIISWMTMVVVAVFLVLFTISNRPEIIVELWPLPYTLNLPLYLLLLVSAFLGFIAGVIITFFSSGTMRKNFRKAEKKAGNLEKELKKLRDDIVKLEKTKKPENI
ncbi:MAG: hypothetical protein CMM51_04105 [Rhodospirillaceae bacterium]|nr:hypothetical protein [Rhodospirillaceae bacterium]